MYQVYKKQSRADQASGNSGSKRELEVREQMVVMQWDQCNERRGMDAWQDGHLTLPGTVGRSFLENEMERRQWMQVSCSLSVLVTLPKVWQGFLGQRPTLPLWSGWAAKDPRGGKKTAGSTSIFFQCHGLKEGNCWKHSQTVSSISIWCAHHDKNAS